MPSIRETENGRIAVPERTAAEAFRPHSSLFHLDLAQSQRILYATFKLVVGRGRALPVCHGCHYFLYRLNWDSS